MTGRTEADEENSRPFKGSQGLFAHCISYQERLFDPVVTVVDAKMASNGMVRILMLTVLLKYKYALARNVALIMVLAFIYHSWISGRTR
jgi:hypothetical protein